MKKILALMLLFAAFGNTYSQVRLVEVDPTTEFVSIKNFGGSSEDISSFRLCALFAYKTLSTMTVESGDLNLGAGETVVVSGWALNNNASDLGIYLATGSFGSAATMVDFTQWGGGGLGRESVAVTKGIWSVGDFIDGDPSYTYIGDGTQNGLTFWQAAPNTEADITSYSFPEETGEATINATNHTVDVEVEFGTDVTSLIATFALSEGASAQVNAADQESGVTTIDFSSSVTYTITAEDGTTTQDWIVTVTVALNEEADILTYSFTEQTGNATIGDGTVDIEVTMGTDLTNLVATFTLSENASSEIAAAPQVSGVTANNFTNLVTYTVAAEDGTTKDWIVTVTEAQPSNTDIDFLTFSFPEQTAAATINAINHTIDIEVIPGTDPSGLAATFSLSEGASAEVGSDAQESGVTVNDFTNAVIYKVTAEDGITLQNWTVIVTVELNTDTDILSFSLPDHLGDAAINLINHTVDIEVNSLADITDQVATFNISTGASAEVDLVPQVSGSTSNNFTNSVTYKVTAEDGLTVQNWVVTVMVVLNNETDFITFSFSEQTNPAIIDNINHTINVEVEQGTDLTVLVATYELSFGAQATVSSTTQISATTVNDFTFPLDYTITAEDGGSVQDWQITVKLDSETDFLSFSFPEETESAAISSLNHSIFIEVFHGTDLTGLVASFTLSDGATAEINGVSQESGVTANDFTNLVTYKVVSSVGAIQNWLISVTVGPSMETNFLTFSIADQSGAATIDEASHTIETEVLYGSDLSNIVVTFTISEGAVVTVNSVPQESGVTLNNFTDPVIYIITAEDGVSTQEWIITVIFAPNTEAEIISFGFSGLITTDEIDNILNTIDIEVSLGTDLTDLVAIFMLSEGARTEINGADQQTGSSSNDFTNPLVYKVIAEDGVTSRDWTVTVTVAMNAEAEFLSFSFPEETGSAIINKTNHIIDVEVPFGTDVTSLVASFTLSEGAVARINGILQESGVTVNNFSGPMTYTVTSEDGLSIQDWSVCTIIAPNTEAKILNFSFSRETQPSVIDDTSNQVMVEVETGTDITNLLASFELSEGGTAEVNGLLQESGVTLNDFTNPVFYKVIAQDGITIEDWTILVSQQQITAVSSFNASEELILYPNPVVDRLELNINNQYIGTVDLILRDISGKVITKNRYHKNTETMNHVLNINSNSPIILVELSYQNQRIFRRIATR